MAHTTFKKHLQAYLASLSSGILLHGQNGEQFIDVLCAIAASAREIAHILTKPALFNMLGETGSVNVQGEHVQKLDDVTNTILIEKLKRTNALCAFASEELEDFVYFVPSTTKQNTIENTYSKATLESDAAKETGRFVAFFDPLDGSSNIDVNISVGTIFSIFYLDDNLPVTRENLLQAGKKQIAAGYVAYGAATMLVYSTGKGVSGFTLDNEIECIKENACEAFVLTHPDCHVPRAGKYYSANLGNFAKWSQADKDAISVFQVKTSLRYVGSLIADFHRTLLYGGLFSYPADKTTKKGKLRLMYEASPLAFLMEQAGGKALDGNGLPILERVPQELHERVAFLFGSPDDVDLYRSYFDLEHLHEYDTQELNAHSMLNADTQKAGLV